MSKKILMVLTSHAELGNTGEKTGFWVEEFAAPYYAFVDAGVEVTLAIWECPSFRSQMKENGGPSGLGRGASETGYN